MSQPPMPSALNSHQRTLNGVQCSHQAVCRCRLMPRGAPFRAKHCVSASASPAPEPIDVEHGGTAAVAGLLSHVQQPQAAPAVVDHRAARAHLELVAVLELAHRSSMLNRPALTAANARPVRLLAPSSSNSGTSAFLT